MQKQFFVLDEVHVILLIKREMVEATPVENMEPLQTAPWTVQSIS